MISGELETNGDHWRTLAVSLVRLSLSHQDQEPGVRKGRCLLVSPGTSGLWSHVQPQHLPFITSTSRQLFVENTKTKCTWYRQLCWPWLDKVIGLTVSWAWRLPTLLLLTPTFYWTQYSGEIWITCLILTTFIRDGTVTHWLTNVQSLLWHFTYLHPGWGCQWLSNDSLAVCWIVNEAIRPPESHVIQGWKP